MKEFERANYMKQSRETVRHEVMAVVDLIAYRKHLLNNNIKNTLKNRVHEACDIASALYSKTKDIHDQSEIETLIVSILSSIPFEDTGNGEYFILSMDGRIIFSSTLGNGRLTSYSDPAGRLSPYMIRNMIQLVKAKKESFYEYFSGKSGYVQDNFQKTSFVKLFKPYNWIIGASVYDDDMENRLKEELLKYISKMRYGDNDYIFVNRFNGDALVADGHIVVKNRKLWEVFHEHSNFTRILFEKEYREALKPKGGYLQYLLSKPGGNRTSRYPKISFVYGDQNWGWIIGSGMYLDEIDKKLVLLNREMLLNLEKDCIFYPFVIFIMVLFFIFYLKRVNSRLKHDFNEFLSFFHDAILLERTIDSDELKFSEFRELSIYANRMIEEKIASRDTLYNEKEKLLVIIKSIGDAVITTDISGRVDIMNAVAENLTGFSNEGAKGIHISEVFNIVNAKTFQKVENPVAKVLESGKIICFVNDTMLISRDGRHYQIDDSVAPIRDKRENIRGAVLIFRDMTEEYEIRDRLQQSEKNLRLFFEAARNVAFIRTDALGQDSHILEFSLGGETIFGYKRSEILGNSIAVLFPNEDVRKIDRVFRKMRKTREVFSSEITLQKMGEKKFEAYLHACPVLNDAGEMIGVIGVIMDITEKKEAEYNRNLLDKLKSLGVLAGGIAHDFNNIMAGIFGNIDIARTCLGENDPAVFFLDKAFSSMDRAVSLSNQLLTFSGGGSPVKECVSLSDFLRDIVLFNLSGSNIKPIFDIKGDLLDVAVDKDQMAQVFFNLIKNAKEAMLQGGTIHLSAENIYLCEKNSARLISGDYIMIRIEDNGAGIDCEYMDYVFDPYFTTKSESSGLGLATAHSIISKHGGSISVNKYCENGAGFVIYLPVSSVKESVEEKSIESADLFNAGNNKKILIVDDENVILDVAKTMLEMNGYLVETAINSDDALALYASTMAETSGFDGVIMDLTLPGGKGGKDLVRDILDIDPDAKVIASSGYSNDSVFSDYRSYGFQGTIVKPYSLEKLLSVVNEAIYGKKKVYSS